MPVVLDLADIQGNILTAYGKQGFPRGRVLLLHFTNRPKARAFVSDMLPKITTALRWSSTRRPGRSAQVPRPECTVNIGFTWYGLLALGIPTRTLRNMPDEFIDGMARRASMLGDNNLDEDRSKFAFVEAWDEVWRHGCQIGPNEKRVHAFVLLNAAKLSPTGPDPLEAMTAVIEQLANEAAITLLSGHHRTDADARFQELSALFDKDGDPCAKEHFGFDDAIGDPVFDGQLLPGDEREALVGNGALDGAGKWRTIATGEFLLGYPDEAQEIAGAAMPLDFSRNGTFVAYRKIHQNVATFRTYLMEAARSFGAISGIDDVRRAHELLLAKIAGRWTDGVPVSLAPTLPEWDAFNKTYPEVDPTTDQSGWMRRNRAQRDFSFRDDPGGVKCPITAHMRRVNTRDDLDPTGRDPKSRNGSILNNRRRILRRGLPYGRSPDGTTDAEEHGIVMLATCASLFRQFEFMQQQWLNYGLDAGAGNDTCPLVGNHVSWNARQPPAKFVIPADPASGHPPFILAGIPQFVETRGGDYFFMPSMTALRMIGMGVVDPT